MQAFFRISWERNVKITLKNVELAKVDFAGFFYLYSESERGKQRFERSKGIHNELLGC